MARSLGVLTLDLVAKIGGFTAGMNQAQREADKSAKAIERSMEGISVASVAVGTAIGSVLADGIRAAAAAFPALIDQAASFQDIADKTGGSAEGFANFAVSAKVAGVEMDTIATASTKLSKALFGIDEESKGAAQGLKAIGIDLKTFADLRPDEQIKKVAEQFGLYADGANKAAAAQLIFGKNGAELLKFFKDYTDSGGDVNILTAEMIQQSDDFLDAQTRLRAELSLMASALATNFIEPLNALITVIKSAAAEIISLDAAGARVGAQNGVRNFAQETGRALASAIDYVAQTVREFKTLVDFVTTSAQALKQAASFDFAGAAATGQDFRRRYGLDELGRKIGAAGADAGKTYVDQFNAALANQARKTFASNDPRRIDGGGGDTRPQIAAVPRAVGGGGGRRGSSSAAARISEAERYLESLQKQLEKTQELTTVEQVLLDIQKGRLGTVNEGQKTALLDVAAQIDANKQLAEAEKQRIKVAEEARKKQEAFLKEGAALTEANRAPIEIWLDDLKRAKELLDGGAISAETYSRQVNKIGAAFLEADEPVKKTLTEWDEITKNFAENIQRTIGDGLVDILDGNFKDIGSNFAKMLKKMAADALAAQITRNLFGDSVKGGEGSGWIGALFSAFGVSGARANGGPVAPNSLYRVNEKGPEMFQAANGNQYLMTGAKGGSVIPNGGGGTNVFNIMVPESVNRNTGAQIAAEAQRKLASGSRNT